MLLSTIMVYGPLVCVYWYVGFCLAQTTTDQHITVQPRNTNVILGESATLYCTITNLQGIPFWTKDAELYAVSSTDSQTGGQVKRWAIFGDESVGEFNLQIIRVEASDAGVYACNVTVPAGSSTVSSPEFVASQPAVLHVFPPPVGNFPECLISIEGTLEIGEAVEFICAFRNTTTDFQLNWRKRDDDSFTPTSLSTNVREGYVVTQFYHSVTIDDHLSIFQCVAESPALPTSVSCTTGFILVRHVPDVSIAPRSSSANVGGQVNFTCVIESSYPVHFNYTWYYKGQPILSNGGKFRVQGIHLSINDITAADNEAEVACVAVNSVGSSRATALVDVMGVPIISSTLLLWLVPTAALLFVIVVIILIAIAVLECPFCCSKCDMRARRRKKLKANAWTAEKFAMEAQLNSERRNSDATTDFYLTRTFRTPDTTPSRDPQRPRQHDDLSHIQETAIDNVNLAFAEENGGYQVRPDYERIVASTPADPSQRASYKQRKTRAERDRIRQHKPTSGNSKLLYADLDMTSSPTRNPSPGLTDSGLDYQSSSFEESRSPTPRQERTIYSQIRPSPASKARRVGTRISVRERQAILDDL